MRYNNNNNNNNNSTSKHLYDSYFRVRFECFRRRGVIRWN